jgi:hypothetical protein
VTDLLLRRAQAGRAGAQDDDNYDVIDADGLVIWRIFRATRSPSGTPWMWTLAYGGPREPNVDARIYRHSLGAGTERHDEECISSPAPF